MDRFETHVISETQEIEGVLFPKEMDKRKLILTGPPGSGKSTIIRSVKGWPEEGYLDISSPEWWKSQALNMRPRELHFGLPFLGYDQAVPVYDTDSLDESTYLEIDFFRIPLPPAGTSPLATNFRDKFVFEFLLPPAKVTFERRRNRSQEGSHHVDKHLTLTKVQEELEFFQSLALFFHQSGMNVHVREDSDGPPRRFVHSCGGEKKGQSKESGEFDQRLDQFKLRQRILSRSWSTRGNKELLDLFVEMVPKALNVERCSIFINDSVDDTVWLQSGTGLNAGDIEVNKKQSIVGQVIESSEYLLLENMDQIPGIHKEVDAKTGFVTRNELCVPIKSFSATQAAGAILVLNKKEGAAFEEGDRIFLEKVARHLETAIESIYLRQEMIDFSELLAASDQEASYRNMIIYSILGGVILLQAFSIAYLMGLI
ncbi:MAG: GAF domain-containing protein [Magnetococcales bacterium]|nr:GAF domain-containing protein [Magnetococcales bacterium]